MKDISENNLMRFTKITKKKEGMFANFKAKGIHGGTAFSANITVDLSAAEVDPGDSLEKIIEECARIAEKDIKKSNLQFEGLQSI
jgi:hypothetical protein